MIFFWEGGGGRRRGSKVTTPPPHFQESMLSMFINVELLQLSWMKLHKIASKNKFKTNMISLGKIVLMPDSSRTYLCCSFPQIQIRGVTSDSKEFRELTATIDFPCKICSSSTPSCTPMSESLSNCFFSRTKKIL